MALVNRNTTGLAQQAPKSGYGFVQHILDQLAAASGPLVELLDAPHKHGGRPGYPARSMLRLHHLQFISRERYANRFLQQVNSTPRLLEICGLKQAPSEGAYCQFRKSLKNHQKQIDRMIAATAAECDKEIERLREAGIVPSDAPRLGEILAIDATDIAAYANPKKRPGADSDARWGYRTPKNKSNAKGESELFYGYKAHAINDAHHGLPIYVEVRPANVHEGPRFPADLDAALELHPRLKPRYILADKGYDSLANFQHTVKQGLIPIIAVRNLPKGQRLHDGIYTNDGRPTCLGQKPMDYLGTDSDGDHWFRCPNEGCQLRDKVDWSRYCDFELSEQPEGKLLRIMGVIPRFTREWQEIYRKRSSIERYFSSSKHSRLLNQHQHRGLDRVSTHVKMATLTYLLTALAHLAADDYAGMRQMSVNLPRVEQPTEPPGVQGCMDCNRCPQYGGLAA